MNKIRKGEIRKIMYEIQELQNRLDELYEEENVYQNNIPENLMGSERYEISENAIYQMECAIDSLSEAYDELSEIVEV